MPLRLPMSLIAVALLSIGTAAPGHAASLSTPQEAARQYVQAESTFDLPALKAVLDPQFVEISPLGQVDEYAAVLSFYTPEKKVAAPPVQLGPMTLRNHGDTAVMDTQLSYALPGRVMTLTLVLVARKTAQGGWTLLSAQYTPVRANQHPPAP